MDFSIHIHRMVEEYKVRERHGGEFRVTRTLTLGLNWIKQMHLLILRSIFRQGTCVSGYLWRP